MLECCYNITLILCRWCIIFKVRRPVVESNEVQKCLCRSTLDTTISRTHVHCASSQRRFPNDNMLAAPVLYQAQRLQRAANVRGGPTCNTEPGRGCLGEVPDNVLSGNPRLLTDVSNRHTRPRYLGYSGQNDVRPIVTVTEQACESVRYK